MLITDWSTDVKVAVILKLNLNIDICFGASIFMMSMIIYDPHQQLIIKGSRRAETYEAGGGTGGTCPQNSAINKQVPLFSEIAH